MAPRVWHQKRGTRSVAPGACHPGRGAAVTSIRNTRRVREDGTSRPRPFRPADRSTRRRLTGQLALADATTIPAPLPFYATGDDSPAKREILRAALELFSERGLAATSVRDIADESGYTNPALYKHFAAKDELALYLFERCHIWVWTRCAAAREGAEGVEGKLEAYVGAWLELLDEAPQVLAFLADSARDLWPSASATVRRKTMIGLARTLAGEAPRWMARGTTSIATPPRRASRGRPPNRRQCRCFPHAERTDSTRARSAATASARVPDVVSSTGNPSASAWPRR